MLDFLEEFWESRNTKAMVSFVKCFKASNK